MNDFTPLPSLAGGLLIGLAAGVLLLFNGQLAGVSGILGGVLAPRRGEAGWRLWFLGGLLAGGLALRLLRPEVFPAAPGASTPVLVAAGLLVGFGTRLGSGCTSGHGVCGASRLSARSVAATLTFMICGALTVLLVRHVIGRAMKRSVIAFLSGAIFAIGLGVSGMTRPAKVLAFLDVTGAWDASLAFVMLGAIGLNVIVYRLVLLRAGPLLGGAFEIPRRQDIDRRLLIGAGIFGVGWGLAGYCPGPGIVSIASGRVGAIAFVAAMIAGQAAQHPSDAAREPSARAESSP